MAESDLIFMKKGIKMPQAELTKAPKKVKPAAKKPTINKKK